MQNGPRGRRERDFYEKVRSELRSEKATRMRVAAQAAAVNEEASDDEQASVSGRSDDESGAQAKLPFSTRNAAMLTAVPSFRECFTHHVYLSCLLLAVSHILHMRLYDLYASISRSWLQLKSIQH